MTHCEWVATNCGGTLLTQGQHPKEKSLQVVTERQAALNPGLLSLVRVFGTAAWPCLADSRNKHPVCPIFHRACGQGIPYNFPVVCEPFMFSAHDGGN